MVLVTNYGGEKSTRLGMDNMTTVCLIEEPKQEASPSNYGGLEISTILQIPLDLRPKNQMCSTCGARPARSDCPNSDGSCGQCEGCCYCYMKNQ